MPVVAGSAAETTADRDPPNVLLTGFPGFLGSALLERLLARGDGPVACLVQPRYADLAERRANDIVERYGGVADTPATESASVQLYEGDITEPDLGLGERLAELAAGGSITELYHLAAVYDLGVDAELAAAVNVRGTEHVLDVAETLEVERLQYVSTCYVSGRYDGVFTETHLDEGQSFNNHYERSKFRAEVLVRDRMDAGLSTTIYRPAITVGDSQTGETDKYDGPYYLLRFLLAQPAALSVAPALPGSAETELNVVPRDFVVDAIAHLSDREDTAGEVYQLCDPAPLSVPAFVESVADAVGHRVVRTPTPKPVARRTFAMLARRNWSAEPAAIDYFDHPTRYACPNTRRALRGSGIECPPFDSYVGNLVAYVRDHPDLGDEAMV
jgi:thioester reductase-like protein